MAKQWQACAKYYEDQYQHSRYRPRPVVPRSAYLQSAVLLTLAAVALFASAGRGDPRLLALPHFRRWDRTQRTVHPNPQFIMSPNGGIARFPLATTSSIYPLALRVSLPAIDGYAPGRRAFLYAASIMLLVRRIARAS